MFNYENKNSFLLSLTILFTGVSVIKAQHPLKEADNAFKYSNTKKHLMNIKQELGKSENQIEVRRVTYQIAECYRIMGDIKMQKIL